ncbi:LPS export ABC transporter periplasmic protein LptC [Spongiivirga citrea]|uniref:LPS export ABC transporter periplasmic protein LptC n=1 Tax=Spongiivirga citrea TaxID=1481457 RepID=A0A6M0CJT9_9FLAO|nr:LPS export ABC transporter periplasmic protein LptC [Spongiivirga citrea]NER18208.1 LPS export ABC transporter periplasmic protein LptC [Spongiivirga citrea]
MALFFSCKNDFKEVEALSKSSKFPSGEGKNIRLTYTDSGKVVVVLRSPLSLDYSNQSFRYREFPEGIHLEFYDDAKNKSEVTSDYAILYDATSLIDLQGNVEIKTHDGGLLKTSQLYWDQNNQWMFTKKRFTFESEEGPLSGTGLDADRNFKKIHLGDIDGGEIPIGEIDKEEEH